MRKIVVAALVAGGAAAGLAAPALAVPPPATCPTPAAAPAQGDGGVGTLGAAGSDTASLGNASVQGNNQQVWLNQQPCQEQPVAVAVADASGNSAIDAGGGGNGSVGSGNAVVFAGTRGGLAVAGASNNNSTNALIVQGSSQRTRQANLAIVAKLTLVNSPVVIG